MQIYLIAALASLGAIVPIDIVWLTTMSKQFYTRHLGHLIADAPTLWPAVAFYCIYAAVMALLVVVPAVEGEFTLGKTYLYGMALGLAAYAAYDLTNQATMRDWPVIVTVVDIAWGALLTGVVAVIATVVTRHFS